MQHPAMHHLKDAAKVIIILFNTILMMIKYSFMYNIFTHKIHVLHTYIHWHIAAFLNFGTVLNYQQISMYNPFKFLLHFDIEYIVQNVTSFSPNLKKSRSTRKKG